MVHRFEQCTGIGHKRLLFFGLTLSALRQTGQEREKKVFKRETTGMTCRVWRQGENRGHTQRPARVMLTVAMLDAHPVG